MFLGLLWWVLAEGSFDQAWIGGVVITAAIWAGIKIRDSATAPVGLRAGPLFRFIPYFAYHSCKGGIDVARLAFSFRRTVKPSYHDFRLRIPETRASARIFFAACLCVFPGTLSCVIDGDTLVIHALDEGLYDVGALEELEELTASIFAIDLANVHL